MSDFDPEKMYIARAFSNYMSMNKDNRKRFVSECLDVLLRDDEHEFLFEQFDDLFHDYQALQAGKFNKEHVPGW